jgi:hypothetical protein
MMVDVLKVIVELCVSVRHNTKVNSATSTLMNACPIHAPEAAFARTLMVDLCATAQQLL